MKLNYIYATSIDFQEAYSYLFGIALVVIAICMLLVIIKTIIGPRISDRLVNINMISTLVTSCIIILSVFLSNQTYLLDICMIYVLISFLSVCVFDTVYINTYLRKKRGKSNKEDNK
ncbi:MAG: monovalent cation/H+ antiporter complex subunit F [Bacilli bacterium]